jgi:hypothetical protein
VFTTNAGWLDCAAIPHNIIRAAGALATAFHTRARTLRTQLINTPGRIARSAGRRVLHPPRDRPWAAGLDELFRRALHDPRPATTWPPGPRATLAHPVEQPDRQADQARPNHADNRLFASNLGLGLRGDTVGAMS